VDQPRSRFVVLGAGGHGRVVADLIRACGGEVLGYVDADRAKLGQVVDDAGRRVVAGEAEYLDRIGGSALDPSLNGHATALAIGDNYVRSRLLSFLAAAELPALIHPSAVVSPAARLGRGTVVLAQVVVNARACIGDGVILNSGAIVEHDCVLGDAVHISPGAVVCGKVQIGKRTWIGAGATVIQGITVGADAVVGAGAVVLRDIPDGVKVVGNPARPLLGD
jgi:sugar O-acyltransferase (sialic acid O-acetyltransferase NeuD family)